MTAALRWQVFFSVLLYSVSFTLATDEDILLEFKAGFSDSSGVLSNWKSTSNLKFCNWTGVTCDPLGLSVQRLELGRAGLSGTITSTIDGLASLQSFVMSFNSIRDSIPPSFGNLQQLQTLDLSFNQLSAAIPDSLGNCSALTKLDLSYNQLVGSIPDSLGNCSNLLYLDLSGNLLSGRIPDSLGNCSELSVLHLGSNNLTGFVPNFVTTLDNMTSLTLSNNLLNGPIPNTWGIQCNTSSLDLSTNFLVGSIPNSLSNCANLSSLNLTLNSLSGSVPSVLGSFGNLSRLYLSDNLFTGEFPLYLFEMGKLGELVLSNNSLNGSLPDSFQNLQLLSKLDLSRNYFTGDIPSTIGNCVRLIDLSLSHNFFTGPIPVSIGNIVSFQKTLDLSDNSLSGSIPSELGNLVSISAINLSANHLSGSIPSQLQGCLNLQSLDLSDNDLSGEIPINLAAFSLATFWNLSNNNLSGPIPAFNIKNLNVTAAWFLPGNDGLCGQILSRPCPESGAPTPGVGPTGSRGPVKTYSWKVITYAGIVPPSLILCFYWFYWRYKVRHLRDAVTWYAKGDEMIRLTVKDLLTATDNFNASSVVGQGGTSTVFRGLLPYYPFIIAVKKFQDDECGRLRLIKEAGIMRGVRHRNLVGALGIASFPKTLNVLVLEFMSNGSLNQHLHKGDKCELSWDLRLKIAIDVAAGVYYMHEEVSPLIVVIHGDLKPANVFLDSDFVAKVGDFGLAKTLANGHVERTQLTWEGTFGYAPPEHGEGLISAAGDVYSFGVLILEIVTRRRPTNAMFVSMGVSFVSWIRNGFPQNVGEIVDPSLAEDLISNKYAIELFIRVGLLCTLDNPRERPRMRDALEMLKTIAGPVPGTLATPIPTMEQLIAEPSFTSFLHAKSWGWINQDFLFDKLATVSNSWFSLFQLDMRDSRTLKAMGFDTNAIATIRKRNNKSKAPKHKPRGIGAFMRVLFGRKQRGVQNSGILEKQVQMSVRMDGSSLQSLPLL